MAKGDRCKVEDCNNIIKDNRNVCAKCRSKKHKYGSYTGRAPVRSLKDRFWSNVNKTNSCWLWHGMIQSQGYGHIWLGDKTRMAHRVSWELHYGEIPKDTRISHKCNTNNCVNPDHLCLENILSREDFFWSNVKITKDCFFWLGYTSANGYGYMPTKYGQTGAHRFSWELHNGSAPYDMHVLHKCDVRNCVNPSHLFLGTHQDNMKDMTIKGRRKWVSKLNHHEACTIKDLISNGVPIKDIAERFGVSSENIYKIKWGKTWRDIT